jgi:cation diffusion facilitator family transporter
VGFAAEKRAMKLSAATLFAVGVIELVIGYLGTSVALESDGTDSIGGAAISLVAWLGLRFSQMSPTQTFNFGYFKLENLAALVASMGLVVAGASIVYLSYTKLSSHEPVGNLPVVIATLAIAGSISTYWAFILRRMAKRQRLQSLRVTANNAAKDATGSFVLIGAMVAVALGLSYMDAIGGLFVAAYIFEVAYVSIRESSSVLLDAFHDPDMIRELKGTIEKREGLKVDNVRLRKAGPYVMGSVRIIADPQMTILEAYGLKTQIRADLRRRIKGIGVLSITFNPPRANEDDEAKIADT